MPVMSSEFSLRSEYKRKAVHIGSSAFALLLRWLNFWQAALLALAALLFNLLILPRIGGKNLYRDEDVRRGYPLGILLYPLSVLLMILFFSKRLYIVAAAWAIMAWGDGFASVFGRKFGRIKIPWNQDRSYAGSFAFLIFCGIAAIFFTFWTWKDPAEPIFWYLVAIPFLATFVAAMIETIPMGVNDNISVPLSAAFFMFALHQIDPAMLSLREDQLLSNLIWGAGINLMVGGLAYFLRLVSFSGFAGGFLVGTLTFVGGYRLYLILVVFFIVGSAA